MQTVLRLIAKAGGYRRDLYVRIENPPHPPLVVEALARLGPLAQPVVSVAQLVEVDGTVMRDSEMRFEFLKLPTGERALDPYFWLNDFVGATRLSRYILRQSQYVALPALHAHHERFAAMWDNNLLTHGFLDAFDRRRTER